MKIEIGEQRPPHLKEYWPGQYHFFSHLEYTAGLTPEPSGTIAVPRIGESFLALECRLHSITDLSERGITAMIVGRVLNMAMDENFAHEIDGKYTDAGFMFNIHSPKDLIIGEGNRTGVAALRVARIF